MTSPDGGLRAKFREKIPHFHWQSIEVGTVGRGVPDSNFCWEGTEGWVEFKCTETNSAHLRPEQVAWISRRHRAGGRVFVAVRHHHNGGPRKGDPVDDLYLYSAADVVALHEGGLSSTKPLAHLTGPSRNWDWDLISSKLIT